MSYFLCVLCRSDKKLTVGEIAEFIDDGVFFDPEPTLTSSPKSPKSQFKRMEVKYDRKRRPIILKLDQEITEELDELIEIAKEAHCPKRLLQQIANTRQIFAIEINQINLTEEAWALCDCLEAYVASLLDGIVYAPDDGFYDKKLKLIHRLST